MTAARQTATALLAPVVDHPPAVARIGDVVYREDLDGFAVNTVLGWLPCRPWEDSAPSS